MNNYNCTKLNDDKEVDALVKNINWDEAFIKESHFYSPSYLISSGIVAADSKLFLRIAICLPENESKVIEFQFDDIEELCLFTKMDMSPKISFRHNEVEFRLFSQSGHCIRCKSIHYKMLANFYSSDCSIYTDEDLYIK